MKSRILSLLIAFLLIGSAAHADQPFRNHRYDAFKVLTVKKGSIVFIGNSITNMHEWWEAFGSNDKILNRGVSGAVTDEVLANLGGIIAGKPRKMFLMIGVNDFGTARHNTVEHVSGNIRTIVERIRKESPATKLYVQSILPSSRRDLNQLKTANSAIQAICAEHGATYIDLWDKLLPIAKGIHTQDGLHLSASGYEIWCREIAKHVGEKNIYVNGAPDLNSGLGGSYGMRSSYFGGLGVRKGDVLLIGDEMIHGGEWHELLGNAKVKNRGTGWGYPGPGIDAIKAQIKTILKGRADNGKPAQIYLYTGTADVRNTKETMDSVEKRYRELIATVHENAPGVPLYLMSLLPQSNAEATKRVTEMNERIQAIAKEENDNNVRYVDIYTPLSENGKTNPAFFNGEYLYGKGYAKVAQVLAQTIRGCRVPDDSEASRRIQRADNENKRILGRNL